jgi:hypothetical protein
MSSDAGTPAAGSVRDSGAAAEHGWGLETGRSVGTAAVRLVAKQAERRPRRRSG